MKRLLVVLAVVCPGLALFSPAAHAFSGPIPPGFDDGFGSSIDMGPPSWFVGLFVLALIAAVATTLYRVALARQIARDSGMDPDQATAMTLLSENGLDAAYLASNLRPRPDGDPSSDRTGDGRGRPANERLRELQQLRDEGLVSHEEYEIRRAEILDSL